MRCQFWHLLNFRGVRCGMFCPYKRTAPPSLLSNLALLLDRPHRNFQIWFCPQGWATLEWSLCFVWGLVVELRHLYWWRNSLWEMSSVKQVVWFGWNVKNFAQNCWLAQINMGVLIDTQLRKESCRWGGRGGEGVNQHSTQERKL